MIKLLNSEKYRRTIARIFLPIFMIWLSMMPARSYAVVPLVVVGAAIVDTTAAAAVTTEVSAMGTALVTLMGAAVGYFSFHDNNGNQLRFPSTSTNAVPAPAAPASAVPVPMWFATAGSQAQADQCSGGVLNPSFSTPAAACSMNACYGSKNGYPGMTGSMSGSICTTSNGTSTFTQDMGAGSSLCPSGYSGVGCLLVNARLAVTDKANDYSRNGNVYVPIPDADKNNPLVPVLNPDGSLSINGVDAQGRPVNVTLSPQVNGGTNARIVTQGQDAAGNTVNTNVDLSVNPQGLVASATQTQTTPNGSNAPAAAQINLPTDYARVGEAQAAANSLSPKLDFLHADLDPATYTPPATVDPVKPMQNRIDALNVAPATPTINWMPQILPGAFVACHPLPFTVGMASGLLAGTTGSATIDICAQLDIIREILGYLFMVATVIYVFRCFTRSNQAA